MVKTLSTEQFSTWSRALRQSDQRSFNELFDSTHPLLYRYTYYIVNDADAAYDLLQEVYLKLWQIRGRLDPDRSLKALLYSMARNRALNYLRHSSRTRVVSLSSTFNEPVADAQQDTDMDFANLQAKMKGWIDQLPKRRREAFVLSRYDGLSHAEIAEVMGLAPKTVNNHIVLALSYLRKKLDAYKRETVNP